MAAPATSRGPQDREAGPEPAPARTVSLFYFLWPGLLLFLLEQAAALAGEGDLPPPATAVIYVLASLVCGWSGLAVVVVFRALTKSGSERTVAVLPAAYAVGVTGMAAAAVLLGYRDDAPVSALTAAAGCGFGLIMAALIAEDEPRSGLRRAAARGLIALCALAWLLIGPEQYALSGERAPYLALPGGGLILAAAHELRSFRRDRSPLAFALLIALAISITDIAGEEYAARRESVPAATAINPSGPNIVIIVAAPGNAWKPGRHTAPLPEILLRDGVDYRRALSTSPDPAAALASIFTGLYPRSHGARPFVLPQGQGTIAPRLSRLNRTLAESLAGLGYQCLAVSADFERTGRQAGFAQGFDYFNDRGNPAFLSDRGRFLAANLLVRWIKNRCAAGLFDFEGPYLSGDRLASRALAAVDALPEDSRFFLFAGTRGHDPLAISAIVDGLVERGLYNLGLIIVTAAGSVDPESLSDSSLCAPLLVKYPKSWSAGEEEEIFETRRLYYLVLSEAGARFEEPEYPWTAAAEWYGPPSESFPAGRESRAVYFGEWKIVGGPGQTPRLYDRAEKTDLSGLHPEELAEGGKMLRLFLETVPAARSGED